MPAGDRPFHPSLEISVEDSAHVVEAKLVTAGLELPLQLGANGTARTELTSKQLAALRQASSGRTVELVRKVRDDKGRIRTKSAPIELSL
jgi:hypothetical protein